MSNEIEEDKSELAHLILDKPLVAEKIDTHVAAGKTYAEMLAQFITKPGVAYVVIVNGMVIDMNEQIQPGDEVRCVPQIIGG
jgi:molybdopterin converting factor small subunit